MDHSGAVTQTQYVATPTPVCEQRFDSILHASITEIAQKRIAGSQRQECQRGTLPAEGLRVQAVHDFERCAVAADRNKVPDATPISVPGNLSRIPRSASLGYLYLNAASLQPFQRGTQKFAVSPAARRRIYDRKVALLQGLRSVFYRGQVFFRNYNSKCVPAGYNPTSAFRSTDFPISSARLWRLIFIEAVRG